MSKDWGQNPFQDVFRLPQSMGSLQGWSFALAAPYGTAGLANSQIQATRANTDERSEEEQQGKNRYLSHEELLENL